MTEGEKHPLYKTCPQCGEQNRATFHLCQHCGYIFPETYKNGANEKKSKKSKLKSAEIGLIVGAGLGLFVGLLWHIRGNIEWEILRSSAVMLMLVFAGGFFGCGLCSGSRAEVRSALAGLVVGAILGILGIIIQGGAKDFTEIIFTMTFLPLTSGLAWKGMTMGTRNMRIGGAVGAITGAIAAIVITATRGDNVMIGTMTSILMFTFGGIIPGIGFVAHPWQTLFLGILIGISSWVGWQSDPSPIIELPTNLVSGLIRAGGLWGGQYILFKE